MLADANGGIQWTSLPLIANFLGIQHIEPLMHRLTIIKLHRPPEQAATAQEPGNTLAG